MLHLWQWQSTYRLLEVQRFALGRCCWKKKLPAFFSCWGDVLLHTSIQLQQLLWFIVSSHLYLTLHSTNNTAFVLQKLCFHIPIQVCFLSKIIPFVLQSQYCCPPTPLLSSYKSVAVVLLSFPFCCLPCPVFLRFVVKIHCFHCPPWGFATKICFRLLLVCCCCSLLFSKTKVFGQEQMGTNPKIISGGGGGGARIQPKLLPCNKLHGIDKEKMDSKPKIHSGG